MNGERPKVLTLLGEFTSGGAETISIRLGNKLVSEGWDLLWCARKGGPLQRLVNDPQRIRIVGKQGTVDLRYLWNLIRLIKREEIDVVHTHLFGNDLFGAIAARLTNRPAIHTIHGMDSFQSSKRVLCYNIIALFDRIVTVSPALEAEARRRILTGRARIQTIENGIDTETPVGDFGEEVRAELGIHADHMVVGCVGNVKPVKGYEYLLEAAAQVRAQGMGAVFVVAGDFDDNPDYKRILDSRIEALGLRGVVRFLGYRADTSRLMSAFDVFVLPSLSEGLSIALLEAMSQRKAIVATKVGGNTQVLEHDVTAVLLEPRDAQNLARAIVSLLQSPGRRQSLGDAAFRVVQQRFSLQAMARHHSVLYQEVTA
jgi:glycosyltransferase involved in cell wall biosynthesis